MRCLIAGCDTEMVAFLVHLSKELSDIAVTDEVTVPVAVRKAITAMKNEKADELLQGRWGMSFSEFRSNRSQIPEDHYRRDMEVVASTRLNGECILVGFDGNGFPLLVQINSDWSVQIQDDFAVVGEGALLAQSVLMHRQHSSVSPLSEALYCVYEAKKYAERVVSVGKYTHLSVYDKDWGSVRLDNKAKAQLEGLFLEYGPKDLPSDIAVDLSSSDKREPKRTPRSKPKLITPT